MLHQVELTLSPEQASAEENYLPLAAEEAKVSEKEITFHRILRRSIDARGHTVRVNLALQLVVGEPAGKYARRHTEFNYGQVGHRPAVVIVGAGPAGMFAALRLIELGIKPIVLDRGKEVIGRRKDIGRLNTKHIVNPNSNYSFGEGGAGTFSDGKIYTRSKKRGDLQKILEIFYQHGAQEDILYEAHPHIGTDRLPKIVTAIRQTISASGGQMHFNTKVTDILLKDGKAVGVEVVGVKEDGQEAEPETRQQVMGEGVILATGHSARDIYELLHQKGIQLQEKAFAMGVRIEHPQDLIDSIQYSCEVRDDYLPAASYNLANQIDGRGVYSFCMCPGGYIVSSSTSPDEVVVNGMSPSTRNSPFANSGMVVEIRPEDYAHLAEHGVLAGLRYQQQLERWAFTNGGKGQTAPAQLMTDFVQKRISQHLPETSYRPGIISSPIHFWMPESISSRLRKAFLNFGRQMKGYLTDEAVVVAMESRTSSPVQIPRDKDSLEHPQIQNLYPCGEGAGYAGGIMSAAMDGEKCAERIAAKVKI